MALDPNILLQGQVPDLGRSVSQGLEIGQQIRNAPILRQLNQQKIQQGERQAGEELAVAVNSIVGEKTAQDITPEVYARSLTAMKSLGVPINQESVQFNPQNVNRLIDLSNAGAQVAQSRRGGTSGVQTNAPIITEQPVLDDNGQPVLDKEGNPTMQKFFTALQSDRATGESRVTNTPISGTITDRLGLSAGDRVTQEQQESIAKSSGKDLGEAKTAEIAAQTKATLITAESRARSQEKTRGDLIKGGLSAAPLLRDINRGLELIDQVDQGGAASIKKDLTDFFGSTSGDTGELNKILAGNVLAGLAVFTGAISEGERAFLEKMETSLKTGKEVNRRQLERLREIHTNAIRKSVSLAKSDDDFATLESIRIDLRGTPLGGELFKNDRNAAGQTPDEELQAKRDRLDELRAVQ